MSVVELHDRAVVMDSGLGATRRPGTTLVVECKGASTCNTRIEIDPTRVLLFDQAYLPVTPPLLELFLARDGADCIIVDFEPHQLVDAISRREAAGCLGAMLVCTAHDIVGHAEIQRAVLLARKEI